MKKLIVLLLVFGMISPITSNAAFDFAAHVRGRILIQVYENGKAWYVYPNTGTRFFMGRPADAFKLMRTLGLGIRAEELDRYLLGEFPDRLLGQILLDVERNGAAYYIYPVDKKAYYLGRPQDAFDIMGRLGLGIANSNLTMVGEAELLEDVLTINLPPWWWHRQDEMAKEPQLKYGLRTTAHGFIGEFTQGVPRFPKDAPVSIDTLKQFALDEQDAGFRFHSMEELTVNGHQALQWRSSSSTFDIVRTVIIHDGKYYQVHLAVPIDKPVQTLDSLMSTYRHFRNTIYFF